LKPSFLAAFTQTKSLDIKTGIYFSFAEESASSTFKGIFFPITQDINM